MATPVPLAVLVLSSHCTSHHPSLPLPLQALQFSFTVANMKQVLWFLLLSSLILLLISPPKQTWLVFLIERAECPSLPPTQSPFLFLHLFLSLRLCVCVCTVFWACGPSHTPAGPNTHTHTHTHTQTYKHIKPPFQKLKSLCWHSTPSWKTTVFIMWSSWAHTQKKDTHLVLRITVSTRTHTHTTFYVIIPWCRSAGSDPGFPHGTLQQCGPALCRHRTTNSFIYYSLYP